MNSIIELLKKFTLTQRCALVGLFFLGGIVVSQLLEKQQLAEKFAVLLYYALCIATFSALTEHHHQKITQYFTKYINKIDTITEQKQYRWTYACYLVFVVVMIQKYWFTDWVTFLTLVMGWLIIYFSWYYFFILSIMYILIIPYLWEVNTTDLHYWIAYFVCWIITTFIMTKKFFK